MGLIRWARFAGIAAVVALAAGSSGLASRQPAQAAAQASVLAYVWEGRPLLMRLDPLTLRPRSRALELGKPPISTWARSPEGARLVLGSGDGARLLFAELRTMRRLGALSFGAKGHVAGLAWPSARRVVVALSGMSGEIVVVDPQARRVVERRSLPGTVLQTARWKGGLALLLAPADRIGTATLVVATTGGVRTVPLPLNAGIDPPAVAQPGLAVSPDGTRAVVVPGGSRVLDVDLRTLAVAERQLSEPVSLLGRLRAWLEPEALAKGPLEGPVRSAAWLPGGRIAVTGWNYRRIGDRAMVSEAAGVRLIDTRDWSVRTLSEGATAVAATGDSVLAFGGTQGPEGLVGTGLRAFGSDGREQFHLFGGRFVAVATAVGRYAYVAEQSEARTRIDVVDLTSGRVVRTVRRPAYLEILRGD
jgi:hypothetical protein